MLKIRLIPTTIAIALLLLGFKIVEVIQGGETFITQVEAQSDTPPPKADLPVTPSATATATPPASPAATGTAAAAPAASGTANAEPKKPKKSDENSAVSSTPGETTDRRYTNVELELLQNLSKRREDLDRWERNIQIKEEALNATESRINEKIAQVEAMKKEVAGLLAQYNEQEDTKIRSLVKIYENMKPADAARIFDEVEMPILLAVIDKMSEKKAAPILAQMDTKKAKKLTDELAEQRKLNTAKLNADTAAISGSPTPGASAPATAPAANPPGQ